MTTDLHGVRIAILTLSDTVAAGRGHDGSGDAIVEQVTGLGGEVVARDVLPDDLEPIRARLQAYADELRVDLVFTTGGSGVAARDVTPEATLKVLERLVPGIVEAARVRTLEKTPFAMLSRAVAGVRGRTMIVNLPGSPQGVKEWLDIILPAVAHAVVDLQGRPKIWGQRHHTP